MLEELFLILGKIKSGKVINCKDNQNPIINRLEWLVIDIKLMSKVKCN